MRKYGWIFFGIFGLVIFAELLAVPPVRIRPALPRGVFTRNVCLSDDGNVLVWYGRQEEKLYLYLWRDPWKTPPQKIQAKGPFAFKHAGELVLSGDGKQAFLNGCRFKLTEKGIEQHPGLPSNHDYGMYLVSTIDGSRLVCVQPGNGESSISVLSLDKETDTYTPERIDHIRKPHHRGYLMGNPEISGDGKTIVYERDGKMVCRRFDGKQWTKKILKHGMDRSVTPAAMHADGKTIYMNVYLRNRGRSFEKICITRFEKNGKWTVAPFVAVQGIGGASHSVYNMTFSPDGKKAAWVYYTRDGKGGILKTELRCMSQKGGKWTPAKKRLTKKGHVQFQKIALSNNGVLAYSIYDKRPGNDVLACRSYLLKNRMDKSPPISLDAFNEKKPTEK